MYSKAVGLGLILPLGSWHIWTHPGQPNQAPRGQFEVCDILQFPPGEEWVGWFLADMELYQRLWHLHPEGENDTGY